MDFTPRNNTGVMSVEVDDLRTVGTDSHCLPIVAHDIPLDDDSGTALEVVLGSGEIGDWASDEPLDVGDLVDESAEHRVVSRGHAATSIGGPHSRTWTMYPCARSLSAQYLTSSNVQQTHHSDASSAGRVARMA